jgi:hypothetical protein
LKQVLDWTTINRLAYNGRRLILLFQPKTYGSRSRVVSKLRIRKSREMRAPIKASATKPADAWGMFDDFLASCAQRHFAQEALAAAVFSAADDPEVRKAVRTLCATETAARARFAELVTAVDVAKKERSPRRKTANESRTA